MSMKEKALGAAKRFVSAVGIVVLGFVFAGALGTFAPRPAQLMAVALGVLGAASLLFRINLPVLKSKWWGAFGVFTAMVLAGVASASLSQETESLRTKDPAAYLALAKASKSDAEYMADLRDLDPAKHAAETKRREEEAAAAEAQAKADYIAVLRREIDGFKTYDPAKFAGSREEIVVGLGMIGGWVKVYEQGQGFSLGAEDKAIHREFRSQIISVQTKAFPVFRRAMGKSMDDALWEENIDVSVFGSRSTTIEFVGAVYAANRNIADTYSQLSGLLNQLRFKRMQFKWYKEADESTFYNLSDSLGDDVFATVTEAGWREVVE